MFVVRGTNIIDLEAVARPDIARVAPSLGGVAM